MLSFNGAVYFDSFNTHTHTQSCYIKPRSSSIKTQNCNWKYVCVSVENACAYISSLSQLEPERLSSGREGEGDTEQEMKQKARGLQTAQRGDGALRRGKRFSPLRPDETWSGQIDFCHGAFAGGSNGRVDVSGHPAEGERWESQQEAQQEVGGREREVWLMFEKPKLGFVLFYGVEVGTNVLALADWGLVFFQSSCKAKGAVKKTTLGFLEPYGRFANKNRIDTFFHIPTL